MQDHPRRNRPYRKTEWVFFSTLALLPFRNTLAGFVPWGPVFIPVLVVGLSLRFLLGRRPEPMFPLPALLLGMWIVVETGHAASWDRSTLLTGTWFLSVLLGFTARRLFLADSDFIHRFCLALWGLATLIAALNPSQKASLEQLEQAIQTTSMDPGFRQAVLHAAAQGRYTFPFGNPIHLGLFLTLSLLAFPQLFRKARTARSPGLMSFSLAVTAGLQMLVLWGTRSRTSLLGLLAGAAVWILHGSRIRKRTFVGWGLVLVSAVGILCVSPGGREMLSRVETVRARFLYWKTASRMIHDHPLLGLGVGGYGSWYSRYRLETPHQTRFPHNLFVEAMTDLGAVGLFLLLWTLLSWSRGLFARAVVSAEQKWVRAALAAFLIATQLGFPHDMLHLAAFGGVFCGLVRLPNRWRHCNARPLAVAFGVGILALPLLARESSHYLFQQARNYHTRPALSVREKSEDFRKALSWLETAIRIWPPLAEGHHYLGSLLRDLGDPRRAEEHLRSAIRWDPTTAFMREDLAVLLWNSGRRSEAVSVLRKAIALHPVKWQYHDRLSRWLFETGHRDEASSEREKAFHLRRFEPDFAAEIQRVRSGTKTHPP